MRKRSIDLSNLPRENNGKRIKWKDTIGYKIPFIYEDITDEIIIFGYDSKNRDLTIGFSEDNKFNIKTSDLKKCALGAFLGKITNEFRYSIGDQLLNEKRNLTITDREYREDKWGSKRKYYKYKCHRCGWTEGWMREQDISRNIGCSCCRGFTVVEGINDIATTNPELIKFFKNKEDAKKYTKCSHKKIAVKCPNCGKEKEMKIENIHTYKSIGCICGDGFSYPEKFFSELLNQLEVDYKYQLNKAVFDWCGSYRYDFYFEMKKDDCIESYIVETHGMQHYRYSGFDKTIEEERENDRKKYELAKRNKIDNYIVIDCRYSNEEYIKNNILNSLLSTTFDLTSIDWNKCQEFALKSLMKEVCEYWNDKEDWESTYTIAKDNRWGISSPPTIRKYLKTGSELGWCDYNLDDVRREAVAKASKSKCKSICIFKDEELLGCFDSATELSLRSEELFGLKLLESGISSSLSGNKKYKGFNFKIN